MLRYCTILLLLCFTSSSTAWANQENEPPKVLVSISPYKYFVEAIAGDTVEVEVMIPAGANLHSYEPTPKQVIRASRACVWFQLGEMFEQHSSPVLLKYNPSMRVIDLRQGIDLISDEEHACSCHPDAMDLHIWLSPKLMKTQAQTIGTALLEAFPQHSHLYIPRLQAVLKNLDQLDKELSQDLQNIQQRHILVSHPAFGYFCKDYLFIQHPIEHEGKDPTPKQLTKTILLAKEKQIKTIFSQKQFSSKAAHAVARELKTKIVELDPYQEEYFIMMRSLGENFKAM
jgi:zinc transport system substrate-binding protein